jgi:hypothetical protein
VRFSTLVRDAESLQSEQRPSPHASSALAPELLQLEPSYVVPALSEGLRTYAVSLQNLGGSSGSPTNSRVSIATAVLSAWQHQT